jgi:hypothetical protein
MSFLHQFSGAEDVLSLRRLFPASQQEENRVPAPGKVQSVFWPVMHAQFEESATQGFVVAKVAKFDIPDAIENAGLRSLVLDESW